MQMMWTEVNLLIPLIIEVIGLTLVVLKDPYIRRDSRRILLLICLLTALLIGHEYFEFWEKTYPEYAGYRTAGSIFGYCARPALIVLFLQIVADRKAVRWFWLLEGVNIAVHLTALFSPICFAFVNNEFRRGPLGYTAHVTGAVLLVFLVWESIRTFRTEGGFEAFIPVASAAVVIVAIALDTFVFPFTVFQLPLTTIAMTNSCVFFYIWLHLKFVHQHEQVLRHEQRIQIMMSQIQPHFLYNTLATIQALCLIDPDKAFNTTGKFGAYLRQNLDTLNQPELIPVTRELEHTQTYVDIESVRFPNIFVEYDTPDKSYTLPALTIQPLVENAIRHGVRVRENGRILIVSRREGDFHVIRIQDNGKGFDVHEAAKSSQKVSHIGLSNVKERIERMCKGTMEVESTIGVGTTITIRIPVKPEDDENVGGEET